MPRPGDASPKTHAMRLFAAWLILTCLGCGDAKSPVPSTPISPAPVPPAPVQFSLTGRVYDTAYRPIPDVRVEVVDGPQAGAFAATDASGRYELPGVFSDAVTIQATKDGYVPFTKNYKAYFRGVNPVADILMELSEPSVNMTGDYTITFTSDTSNPSCSGLPDAARSRTYTVAITPTSRPTSYQAVLSGATFSPSSDRFYLRVAGTFARFDFGDPWETGIIIAEEPAPSTYVSIWGSADLSVGGTTISGSLSGSFFYCPVAVSGEFPRCTVREAGCVSTSHRVLLVRR